VFVLFFFVWNSCDPNVRALVFDPFRFITSNYTDSMDEKKRDAAYWETKRVPQLHRELKRIQDPLALSKAKTKGTGGSALPYAYVKKQELVRRLVEYYSRSCEASLSVEPSSCTVSSVSALPVSFSATVSAAAASSMSISTSTPAVSIRADTCAAPTASSPPTFTSPPGNSFSAVTTLSRSSSELLSSATASPSSSPDPSSPLPALPFADGNDDTDHMKDAATLVAKCLVMSAASPSNDLATTIGNNSTGSETASTTSTETKRVDAKPLSLLGRPTLAGCSFGELVSFDQLGLDDMHPSWIQLLAHQFQPTMGMPSTDLCAACVFLLSLDPPARLTEDATGVVPPASTSLSGPAASACTPLSCLWVSYPESSAQSGAFGATGCYACPRHVALAELQLAVTQLTCHQRLWFKLPASNKQLWRCIAATGETSYVWTPVSLFYSQTKGGYVAYLSHMSKMAHRLASLGELVQDNPDMPPLDVYRPKRLSAAVHAWIDQLLGTPASS
jgi:hypothetical protein